MMRKHLVEKLEDRHLLTVTTNANDAFTFVDEEKTSTMDQVQVAHESQLLEADQLDTSYVDSLSQIAFANFDSGALPSGWQQWNNGRATFQFADNAKLGTLGLASDGDSSGVARVWSSAELQSEASVSARIYVNSLIPVQLFLSGSNLETSLPSYYSVQVTRGFDLVLLRTEGGTSSVLAKLRSQDYVSSEWLRLTLATDGTHIFVQVVHENLGQYLNESGNWQHSPTFAVQVQASEPVQPGHGGVERPARFAGEVVVDDIEMRTNVDTKHVDQLSQNFDQVQQLPSNWKINSQGYGQDWSINADQALSGQQSLATSGSSTFASRIWPETKLLDDVEVSASLYLNSLVPAGVFARGTNLDSASPTYYSATFNRGMDIELTKVEDGVANTIAKLSTKQYFTNGWAKVILRANGDNLRVLVYHPKTGKFLNQNGTWQRENTWAINIRDDAISEAGHAGAVRVARYSGTVHLDNFSIGPATGDSQPPEVRIEVPTDNDKLTDIVTVNATVADASGVTKIEFYVDGVLRSVELTAPYSWQFDTASASNGTHRLEARAYDLAGNIGIAEIDVETQNATSISLPNIPQHLDHIRLAALAYTGWEIGELEQRLLENYIDLVVPGNRQRDAIAEITPDTPLLLYSNSTNIYLNFLEDWLTHAAKNDLDPEGAFYHALRSSKFSGNSPSAVPVDQFWQVISDRIDITRRIYRGNEQALVDNKAMVLIGHVDRFREINVTLARSAGDGWLPTIEYPIAVDENGLPTEWTTLPLLSDTTSEFTQSGQITFDPPADWVPAITDGKALLYQIRLRSTSGGIAPMISRLRGRDYVQAGGEINGVIPAFDTAADANRDGYLNDDEYATRAEGKDARFVHESRMFAPYYGQMRFATNPASLDYREWIVNFHADIIGRTSLSDGFFMDNSGGRAPFASSQVIETIDAYTQEYATLVNRISIAIQPNWVLINTSAGGIEGDEVVQRNPAYFEEFAIRAMAHDFGNFKDLAGGVRRRMSLTSPSPLAVIDSYPTGGSVTDPRLQIATLAYYYMISDPKVTFLSFFGGYEPNSQWDRHWTEAVTYDVGSPTEDWSLLESGNDPSNSNLQYHVIQRSFENALVLYKPLSSAGEQFGGLGNDTTTTHKLDGVYRPLQADGKLGKATNTISLRNGEGAILVPTADLGSIDPLPAFPLARFSGLTTQELPEINNIDKSLATDEATITESVYEAPLLSVSNEVVALDLAYADMSAADEVSNSAESNDSETDETLLPTLTCDIACQW